MVSRSPSTRGSFKMPSFNDERVPQEAAQGAASLQLIDGLGAFDEAGLDAFVRAIRLAECGLSYAVVAIMGPQSSGKSTLLNHLFRTSFKEMDAFAGRSQTTQGVWIARAKDIDPCTIVMDLEGTDGRERGEDDTAFEKQSALFALAVSDIVLINMWCHDIGREQAANKPLLKTVFQVMMRLFTPRKTTLLFVIRDKTRTPLSTLEPILRGDVQKIWESAPKPPKYEGTQLSQFFTVEVTALANFEEKPELFEEQVGELRDRFNNSIQPGGLAGDRRGVVPGSGFRISISDMWKIIKENKDLDLPAHKVMVATVRCEEIAHEKLSALLADPDWHDLDEGARKGLVPGFGKRLSALLHRHLSGYDDEAAYFDDSVRTAKRNYLVTKVLDTVQPAYQAVVSNLRNEAFNKFKQEMKVWAERPVGEEGFAVAVRRCSEQALSDFDKGCSDSYVSQAHWDNGKLREKLHRDIDAHAQTVRAEKIAAIVASVEKRVEDALTESAGALLDAASPDTWLSLKRLLTHETDIAKAALLSDIAGFEPDETEKATMLDGLTSFSRGVVERQARKEASQALLRMKDRFTTSFSHDAESLPRLWSEKDDIRAIAKEARSMSLKGLSILAAIRLDDDIHDRIEPALSSLLDPPSQEAIKSKEFSSDGDSSSILVSNPLAASSWDGVPQGNTLLSPVQCKNIWRQFKAETDYTISQALAAQEAHKNSSSWLPPPWAIAAIVVLGFNEFMALLRNPLYLLIFFVVYLLGKALWVQLDIAAEFRHGFVAGILSLSTKLLPTVMSMLTKLAQEGSKAAGVGNSNSDSTGRSNRFQEYDMQDFSQNSPSENSTSQGSSHGGSSVRNRQHKNVAQSAS
ncbi:protein SEY1 [Marchantia polymorpha subsp. ruderalis]|uniref:Protein ROOT HAIR DEFECTIVE 3 homolog n=4 Tax=Marchantia polymorpha TaxID=3197 RepID=A0AAF6AQ49_MARPO|nr:hypothetical protein MARPO_0153s0041 [Marchantia polymorpha]BBM98569.1 hypothetical protein Mp_1g14480 [Marchantia polymorpha subsp. ruderalis]|eukprot:PTQ28880.1 hypothetical protein MARPO_0153s0041 [Marchantia polymorpha]